ncbi:MAG: hypothetical protein ACXVCK_03045 [Bdellovibrionota bacterium]
MTKTGTILFTSFLAVSAAAHADDHLLGLSPCQKHEETFSRIHTALSVESDWQQQRQQVYSSVVNLNSRCAVYTAKNRLQNAEEGNAISTAMSGIWPPVETLKMMEKFTPEFTKIGAGLTSAGMVGGCDLALQNLPQKMKLENKKISDLAQETLRSCMTALQNMK